MSKVAAGTKRSRGEVDETTVGALPERDVFSGPVKTDPAARPSDFEIALKGDVTSWEPWLYSTLSERCRLAIKGSKAELRELSRTLRVAWGSAWQAADGATRRTVTSKEDTSQLHDAYRLGQLGFASMLIDEAHLRCAGEDFEQVMRSAEYGSIIRALSTADEPTLAELATLLGTPETELRQVMRTLIEEGVVEYHGPGPVRYVLTQAAQASVNGATRTADRAVPRLTEAQRRVLQWIGKGWTGYPGGGSTVMVNGRRVCNVDTMTALEKAGLVHREGDGVWQATTAGRWLTEQLKL